MGVMLMVGVVRVRVRVRVGVAMSTPFAPHLADPCNRNRARRRGSRGQALRRGVGVVRVAMRVVRR